MCQSPTEVSHQNSVSRNVSPASHVVLLVSKMSFQNAVLSYEISHTDVQCPTFNLKNVHTAVVLRVSNV